MPFFDKEFVSRVLSASDLPALVKAYVPELRQSGGRWVGHCPFHEEKTPSFGVKQDAKRCWFFKCHGCGVGGDAAKFLMLKEGIKFPVAIERLAQRAGIPLPLGTPSSGAPYKPKAVRRTREEIEAEKQRDRLHGVALRAQRGLEEIVREWVWDQASMWDACALPQTMLGEARAVLALFHARDVVWCGHFKDSMDQERTDDPERRARIARCFRPASEWLMLPELPGPRICPNAMKAGSVSRSDANVAARRFLVVEHDKLPIDAQAAVLRWLWQKAGLELRAVVFTGSKSLHGWYVCPPAGQLAEIEVAMCGMLVTRSGVRSRMGGMGFDPQIFIPQQPFRLPGWKHDKTGLCSRLWFVR